MIALLTLSIKFPVVLKHIHLAKCHEPNLQTKHNPNQSLNVPLLYFYFVSSMSIVFILLALKSVIILSVMTA